MTMFKRLLAAFALVLSVFAVGLVASGPAQAAPGCPANAICFHNTGSSNPTHERDGADWSPGECFTMPAVANNNTSYITNRSGGKWFVYTDNLCSTWPFGTIYAHSEGVMQSPWNNSISSYRHS